MGTLAAVRLPLAHISGPQRAFAIFDKFNEQRYARFGPTSSDGPWVPALRVEADGVVMGPGPRPLIGAGRNRSRK